MKTPSNSARRDQGFTLVELLVVIVIIVTLVALTVVGFGKARKAAQAAGTQNNLKQIHVVIQDIKAQGIEGSETVLPGFYPGYAGNIPTPGGGGWTNYNWADLVGYQLDFCVFEPGSPVWNTDPSETILQNPLSRHKFGSSDGGTWSNGSSIESGKNRGGFTYNYRVGAWLHGRREVALSQAGHKLNNDATIPYPESTVLIGESDDDGGRFPLATWNAAGQLPQGTHKKKCNVLFVDGSVTQIENAVINSGAGWDKYFELDGPGKLVSADEVRRSAN